MPEKSDAKLGCCSGTQFNLPPCGYMVSNMVSELWELNFSSVTATQITNWSLEHLQYTCNEMKSR